MHYPITQPVVSADIPLLVNGGQVNSAVPVATTEGRTCCQRWKAYHNNYPMVLLVNSIIHLVLTILGTPLTFIRVFSIPISVIFARIVASMMCFVMLKKKSPVFVGLFTGMMTLCWIQTLYSFTLSCTGDFFWMVNHAGHLFSDPLFIGFFVSVSLYTIIIWITQLILFKDSVLYYRYLKEKALTTDDDVTTEEVAVSPIASPDSVFVPQAVPTMLESQTITIPFPLQKFSPQPQFDSVVSPVYQPVEDGL